MNGPAAGGGGGAGGVDGAGFKASLQARARETIAGLAVPGGFVAQLDWRRAWRRAELEGDLIRTDERLPG